MKRSQLSVLAITLAGLAAGQAIAADTSTVTREQVRAELAQAVRAGDIVANNETGERLNAQQPEVAEQLWKDAAADLQKRYDFLAQLAGKAEKSPSEG